MNIITVSDIVEANGKTIRENNLAKQHNIPIGALVEFKTSSWHGDGSCEKIHGRWWVVKQGRDCDGTPLYWLSKKPIHKWSTIRIIIEDWVMFGNMAQSIFYGCEGGFPEESLKVIELSQAVKDGVGQLDWDEEE